MAAPSGTAGLWRATFTLLAGGAFAQALPLLLGPWLTRAYAPEQWGQYTTFAAVAANLAVVACARYEFALPLARDDAEATLLLALCLRVLGTVTLLSGVLALGLLALDRLPHAGWLPLAVAAAGAAQLLALWATRAQRFKALAAGRVVQQGGGVLAQSLAGAAQAGTLGLVLGPVAASAATALMLARPTPQGGWRSVLHTPWAALQGVMRKHREFPLLNTPHAFAGALQDTLAVALLAAGSGEAAVGFWGLALRYLKAPATLVGASVSQALYPKLAAAGPDEGRAAVRQVMKALALVALPLMLVLLAAGPALFAWAFGERWREAGELARALAPYIAAHFVASPLAVVTLAWRAQAWALRLALVGQAAFVAALLLGQHLGGLLGAAWAVSGAMVLYFGWYFWKLATWAEVPDAARV
jgi:O-antigen/teichoic acid export membrane protein